MERQAEPKASIRLLPFARSRAADEKARERQAESRDSEPLPARCHRHGESLDAWQQFDLEPSAIANHVDQRAASRRPIAAARLRGLARTWYGACAPTASRILLASLGRIGRARSRCASRTAHLRPLPSPGEASSAEPPEGSAAPHAANHALVERLSVRDRKMKADHRGGLLERLAERRHEWRKKRSLRWSRWSVRVSTPV